MSANAFYPGSVHDVSTPFIALWGNELCYMAHTSSR